MCLLTRGERNFINELGIGFKLDADNNFENNLVKLWVWYPISHDGLDTASLYKFNQNTSMEKYIQIGNVRKTHGVSGELKYTVDDEYWEDFLEADVLFVDVRGRKTPYFVEGIKTGSLPLMKFEDIDSREEAGIIANKALFMRSSDLEERTTEEVDVADMFDLLPGYLIVEAEAGEVGAIKEVLEFPQQIMAVVDYKEKEILIPLNDVFIQNIDQQKQVIGMKLPEGLLEL